VFIAVGGSAVAVHWSVAVTLVTFAGLGPFVANAIGFWVGFVASFLGHRRLTFRSEAPVASSLGRYVLLACLGLLLNEAGLWLMLATTPLPYPVALVLVIGAVAVVTYFSSKRWVFR
jgi:putative flippase GtrA